MPSKLPKNLKARLLATALSLGLIGGGAYVHQNSQHPSPAVQLAMELGTHYEGSRLEAYQDTAGVWTICKGITHGVTPTSVYTPQQCHQLELAHYQELEHTATQLYTHWHSYNPWVQASMLDMLFNLGAPQVKNSTHLTLANQGNLEAACAQMPRWVWATDAATGQRVQLAGLKNRRQTTAELCSQWGRTGHFSLTPASTPNL